MTSPRVAQLHKPYINHGYTLIIGAHHQRFRMDDLLFDTGWREFANSETAAPPTTDPPVS
ncbi:MAG: hypothetical protein B6D70_11690 [gamma proteobacterium symbiont of Stewartia floridana]|nr:MAG: hypothetical protein B6D76_04310 [gamma proteobacterium symbiont of Stewartia floridana]RLW57786.1 MAG: hypothetical protein B6D75_15970 [gamma proteobacterium symbiont of Stewartia floridana]RLW59759.1 MAG: hypothetical protein B6D70_11690 [gamma proteobacterium symbiont of Stewartia floridana]RLW63369.1 MAG: hypothetical protein B6D73_15475 [gamma proteobacterium symbiont of Stewartia floridana]